MKLTELKPQFLRYAPAIEDGKERIIYRNVDSIDEAQGVIFLCPKCFATNGGPRGTHAIICWSSSRGIPDDVDPKPGRWKLEGTGYADLTLGCEPGKSNSVLLTSGCAWHGFVIQGDVTTC
jgi:hypothetical protein